MSVAYCFNGAVTNGRTKLMDITLPQPLYIADIVLSMLAQDPIWEIYFDKDVNELGIPAKPTLVNVAVGGSIPRNTKIYFRITTIDAIGREGPGSDGLKTITTGSTTDTNAITVTITPVTSAVSYNVYASYQPGDESLCGNTVTTSYTCTTVPIPGARIPTDQDLNVVALKSQVVVIPASPAGAVMVTNRLIVWVTSGGNATPYVSILGT